MISLKKLKAEPQTNMISKQYQQEATTQDIAS